MTDQERKNRIAALRAELKELQATPRSDWHVGFEALLRLKTYKYKGVTIQTEREIGMDAPRTDYVILMDDETEVFEDEVFRIFRKTNILEYKNPNDSLNRRVIHKIIGYAHLLIGTAEHEGDMPEEDVTLSIFRSAENPELWKEMEMAGELVRTEIPGIYRVTGVTKLPFQIVITGELQGDEYAAYRALTEKADRADVERIVEDLEKETDNRIQEYYGKLLSLIAEKNPKVFEEMRRDKRMDYKFPGLMKVFREDVDKEVNEAKHDQEIEVTVIHIRDIMSKLKYTEEQAMDLLNIPESQRKTYAGLVGKATK